MNIEIEVDNNNQLQQQQTNENNDELGTSMNIPRLSLSSVIQQHNEVVDTESNSMNTDLLIMSTQTVISFVYCNKQPSLFNLLTQMLTTNTFTPINPSVEIPFQPSPYPSTIHNSSSSSSSSTTPTPIATTAPSSTSTTPNQSPILSSTNNNTNNNKKKSSLMFNILDQAINAVSQQFKKNFYIHILERPPLPSPTSSSSSNSNQTSDHDQLVAGCLSFINHMLSAAPSYFDFEKYRQVLSSQGVNEVIKTYVKSVSPCVRLELLHYQKHKINGIKAAKQTSIYLDKQNVVSFINRLCKMSFPNTNSNSTNSTIQAANTNEEKMKLLGFESDDLNSELQSTGILGLRNMIYFCARYYRIYDEILQAQIKKHIDQKKEEGEQEKGEGTDDDDDDESEDSYYSFSRVGFTLTNLIYELYIEDENLYEIIFDQDDWFEELFCISFELFDEIWEREGFCQEDYIPVLHKTRAVLSRLKWTNPPSIIAFQKTLGNVLDEMWSKTSDIKEEKEMSARAGGLSDSIMGVPHGGNGGNGNASGNLRFKKFFNEKFKQYRRSTDSVNSDTSEGYNNSLQHHQQQYNQQQQQQLQQQQPSSSNNQDSLSTPSSPTSSPVPHKINTKSLSYRKLFSDLKTSETERKQTMLNGSNGSLSVDQDGGSINGGGGNGESSSLPNTPRYMGDDQASDNGSSSSFSFEKLSRKLRSGSSSIKEKAPKYNALNGELITTNNNNSTDQSASSSNNVSPFLQSTDDQPPSQPPHFNIDDGKRSLKSSGSSIYKSVKKAMVNLGEKGKDISKKVKGSKKNKSKKSSKDSIHNYEEEQDFSGNNSSNVSPYIIPGDLELPTDFRPSLDLDFDKNSDSSYEDSSENETNTLDDIQSIDSTNNINNMMINSNSSIVNSNNISSSNLMNDQSLLSSSTPTPTPTQPTVTIEDKQQQLQQQEPISSSEATPIITSSVNENSTSIPIVVIEQVVEDKNNNNNNINRSISEQSLTDAATLNYQINKQQQRLSTGEETSKDKCDKSDNSSNDQPISPSYPRRQMNIVNGGGSAGRNSTLNSQSSSLSKKPVLSRAPIPTAFSSNPPPAMVKSPSIKHLVTFFEVKSSELKDNSSTVSGSLAPASLTRQKSFKSDS